MKKAAIITLYGNYNFGNKLQNYALQAVLEDYGFEVETLIFSSAKSDRASVGLSDKFKKKIKKSYSRDFNTGRVICTLLTMYQP